MLNGGFFLDRDLPEMRDRVSEAVRLFTEGGNVIIGEESVAPAVEGMGQRAAAIRILS